MDLVFKAELLDGYSGHCPHCGQFAKVYNRQIHSTVARQLIALYRRGGADKFLHTKNFVVGSGAGDLVKARHWDLIVPGLTKPVNGAREAGMWKLTPKGVAFVKGEITIPRYAQIFNNQLIRFVGEEISIRTALGDKFNYQEIMEAI